jgi:hypothetical protein
MNLLNTSSDEWVPTAAWEATKVAHQKTLDEIIQTVGNASETIDEQSMSEADLMKI